MLRVIGGVVAGYLATALLVLVTFTVLYRVLGADGVFQPGTYEVKGIWIAAALGTNVAAALLGGFVCIAVGKSFKAATILSSAVLALGLSTALMTMSRREPAKPTSRGATVSNREAAENAREPDWVSLSNPIVGAAGILMGARLKRKS